MVKRSIDLRCDWLSRIILLFFFLSYCLFSLCSLFMELSGCVGEYSNQRKPRGGIC